MAGTTFLSLGVWPSKSSYVSHPHLEVIHQSRDWTFLLGSSPIRFGVWGSFLCFYAAGFVIMRY
nr:MAG TPA: hypothetical protein [Caudoviricetes sp.]